MNNKYDISLEKEDTDCACGGNCGCGTHEHHHEHGDCCGGHHHEHGNGCCGGHKVLKIEELTEDENAFLNHLISYTYLPVTRFVLKSTKEKDFIVHTLSPVYIEYEDDDMDKVRFVSEVIISLEEKGFISVDYDIPLKNYPYSEYYNSGLYKYFVDTVEEGKVKPGFLGDTAELETGSMAITEQYAQLMEN